jgi:hypothetical protein
MEFKRDDIRSIAFEKINDQFSRGKYLGVEVTIDMTTGYINGPHLVGQVLTKGGKPKEFRDRRQTREASELIRFISQNEGINTCDLIKDIIDAPNGLRGGYIHPYLVPHVASWASPQLAHIIGRIMNSIACSGQVPARLYTDPRVEPRPGCVYFVSDGENIKIGHTYDLPKRLTALQTGNPHALTVVGSVICTDPAEVESRLHMRFADRRVRGEWFRLSCDECLSVLREIE